MTDSSFEVRIWQISKRPDARAPWRLRWRVATRRFSRAFATRALADSFRAQLVEASRAGESFSLETGLPYSITRRYLDVSCYAHAREFLQSAWPVSAAKSRVSLLETLSVALPVLTRDLASAPDPDVLRLALRHALNPNPHARPPDAAELRALAWLERASLPVSALDDPAVVGELLDALSRKLDGSPAAPDYFSRRRRVMHRVLGYAVRKKRLAVNPLSKANLPEGWAAPAAPEDIVDPRSVGGPELVADMLTATSYVGRRQGPRFVAYFGCMFYAMMRPSEVTALTRDGCHLPAEGWGRLIFADASPAAGKAFTDDGRVHEHRGLKGRARQSAARRATRNVPIPPELVTLLREHINRFGSAEDGRLFRSENGSHIHPSTYRQVWARTRTLALTPAQLATPLMRRPYDLRHSGITWRLNAGVPPTEIAAWAGHSVEMLLRVYARCVAGMEDVWISRMEATLRPPSDGDQDGGPDLRPASGEQAPQEPRDDVR
ncbi:MAG: tyrosine-type recombinase/integrase [Streptosporangiaceae bacterium]